MAFVSEGSQYDVGNFQVVFHEGDDVDAIIESTLDKIEESFEGYNQYHIVSLQYRGGNYSRRMMIQEPTIEPFKETALGKKIAGHLQGTVATNFFPVVVEIRLFVSYNEPKL